MQYEIYSLMIVCSGFILFDFCYFYVSGFMFSSLCSGLHGLDCTGLDWIGLEGGEGLHNREH